jgi:hypothetical protein
MICPTRHYGNGVVVKRPIERKRHLEIRRIRQRQHMSAYVSIRRDGVVVKRSIEHKRHLEIRRIRLVTSGYVRIRQDTSGYVRIRQVTLGYVRIREDTLRSG